MKNTIKTELIENFIKENKLSKNKFCEMCKISQSTLNKIMTSNENHFLEQQITDHNLNK